MTLMNVKKVNAATRARRSQAKEDIRRRILDTARQYIAEEGFEALSMRKLAEKVGYSAAALYLHFQSREQIAAELTEEGFRLLLARLQEANAQGQTVPKQIEAVGMAYVRFGLAEPQTYRLIFGNDSAYLQAAFRKNAPESNANQSYLLLVALGEQLKKEKLYRGAASGAELAEMIWAAMHGIVSLGLACAGFHSPGDQLAALTIQTLVKGLTG